MTSAIPISLICFSALLVTATVVPLIPHTHWTVRGWDFPRLQIAGCLILALVLDCIWLPAYGTWFYAAVVPVVASLGYQLLKIFPYTVFWKQQVKKSRRAKGDINASISIISSNVYMHNQKVAELLKHVREKKPDMVLTLETNYWWQKQLESLEQEYNYTVKVPRENLYGMHLYSRLPLEDVEVRYLIDPEIPSIHGYVRLLNGDRVRMHCLHPMPPSPTENPNSTDRDAELLLVGKNIDTDKEPVIVLGDLNDVAWSATTRLFQKISGLLDPRRGRGFYNTFNARYPILRWPLDHFFHSNHFTLLQLERLPDIGSDHFPMYISLHLEPHKRNEQEEPEATADEEAEATEKIQDAAKVAPTTAV